MIELEKVPKDNNKKRDILVDDDEEEKEEENKNELLESSNNFQIKTTDISSRAPKYEYKNKNKKKIIIEPDNYLSRMFCQNLLINLMILSFIIFIIGTEYIYRIPSFKYSLTYEQNLQNSLTDTSIGFFKLISFLGNGPLVGIGLFFILCFFSLVKTITLIFGLIFLIYAYHVMKLIYVDPRPFWLNTVLFQGECETSYGNPSGHCITSFYFFLSLCYYINRMIKIENQKYSNIIKIFVYLMGLLISGLISFSRLVLGVHSIDQVIYGCALGIWLFLVFAFVFKIYDMPISCYLNFYRFFSYIIPIILLFIILFPIPIIYYRPIDVQSHFEKYELLMTKKCPHKLEYEFYSHVCMAGSLIIYLGVGIYLGQCLFWCLINRKKNVPNETIDNIENNNYNLFSVEESINNWNKYIKDICSTNYNLIRVIGLIILSLSPGILYFVIPTENNTMKNIFIYKIGLPLFLIGFLSFGPCFYALMIILKKPKGDL